jgi:hypothetical protein
MPPGATRAGPPSSDSRQCRRVLEREQVSVATNDGENGWGRSTRLTGGQKLSGAATATASRRVLRRDGRRSRPGRPPGRSGQSGGDGRGGPRPRGRRHVDRRRRAGDGLAGWADVIDGVGFASGDGPGSRRKASTDKRAVASVAVTPGSPPTSRGTTREPRPLSARTGGQAGCGAEPGRQSSARRRARLRPRTYSRRRTHVTIVAQNIAFVDAPCVNVRRRADNVEFVADINVAQRPIANVDGVIRHRFPGRRHHGTDYRTRSTHAAIRTTSSDVREQGVERRRGQRRRAPGATTRPAARRPGRPAAAEAEAPRPWSRRTPVRCDTSGCRPTRRPVAFDSQTRASSTSRCTDDTLSGAVHGALITGPDSAEYAIPALPPGEYYFLCIVHPDMNGTVVVG